MDTNLASSNDPLGNYIQQNNITPPLNSIGKNIGDAFQGAVDQFTEGASQIGSGQGNPIVSGLEGFGKMGAGLVKAAASPITGLLTTASNATKNSNNPSPTANLVNNNGITDNPSFQKFAESPAGQTTARVAGDIANYGDIAGGILGAEGVANTSENIWEKANAKINPAPEQIENQRLSSRTTDATPSYNKEMQGQNVKTSSGEIVPRANEGEGLTGKRTVNTSASETQQGKTLSTIKDYPDNGTAMQKEQAIGRAVSTEAENMRSGLQVEDKQNPLDINAQKAKVSAMVKSQLPEDIQAKVGVHTPEDETMLKGMQEKIGAPQPSGGKFDLTAPGDKVIIPRSPAGNFYKNVLKSLSDFNGTREGMLDLRQNIDTAYESARGKLAWGSDGANEIDSVNKDIRNSLNQELGNTTQNTDVQNSLKTQTNLYRAKDTLVTKAQAEANSYLDRVFQNHPEITRLAKRVGYGIAIATVLGGSGYTIGRVFNKQIKQTLGQ